MKKFFMRNDPQTVKDALHLTLEGFVEKYKETTASAEGLTKAYGEIRFKHSVQGSLPELPKQKEEFVQGKEVTFKVIKQDTTVVKNLSTPPEQTGLIDLRGEPLTQATIDAGVEHVKTLVDECIKQDNEIFNNILEATTSKTKKGRKPLANAEERDIRIVQLLDENKKGKEIIEIMKKEGYSVHAPQVTALKKALEAEKKEKAA